MITKIPQIHLDVLHAYQKLGNEEIFGKNLAQIADSLELNYTTVYVSNVTSKLIHAKLLIRNFKDNGSIQFVVTDAGMSLLAEYGLVKRTSKVEQKNIKEEVPQMSIDSNEEVKEEQRTEAKAQNFTENDKEKAILSLINETLLKTVVYCKDLSDQMKTFEQEELLSNLRKENEDLKTKLRHAEMIIGLNETCRAEEKQSFPTIMAHLKCAIDGKIDEHYEMIPWQRELAKEDFRKQLLLLIDEALEDIEKATNHDSEQDSEF